jgi:hypothetical protein
MSKRDFGLRYTFENGDDFQLIEDAPIAKDILSGKIDRVRPRRA